jgi:RNA polymerase sigma-B factor
MSSTQFAPLPRQQHRAGRATSRQERADSTHLLFERIGATTDEDERQRLLDEVVVLNIGVAKAIATRFRRRGIPGDDLEQVACLGLVKAARGFDPAYERDFLSYAVPTIRGEVKKHFRDHGWTVRPPRRIQELQSRISVAANELTQTLGRSPRPSEIARELDEDIEDVTEALAADGCFTPTSLDRRAGQEGTASIGDMLGAEDHARDAVEARVLLAPVVRRLCPRDRRILTLRFFRGWTQEEIARDIGVTQMQVSRLLSRILGDLRNQLD